MKRTLFTLFFLAILCGSEMLQAQSNEWSVAENLFRKGEYTALQRYADSLKNAKQFSSVPIRQLDSLCEIASRIELDFSLTDSQVDKQLLKRKGAFTPTEKQMWEDNDWLEYRYIDGQKRYFNRSVPNLILRINQYADSANHRLPPLDSLSAFRIRQAANVIQKTKQLGEITSPVKQTLTYTLTVKPDAVPAGETIRCWLPYPKENHARQQQVQLISTSQPSYFIAPDTAMQRSVYMEQKAVAGKPAVFQIKYSYLDYAQYFDLSRAKILPYNRQSAIYKKYTREQGRHIVFTPEIRTLADRIAGTEKNPVRQVQLLYGWINSHIIWSGMREYSTIKNIPHYVLRHRRGDCGMQTLLFITMARYLGIPAKWQSGWMLHPMKIDLHDWSEVYYEGVGWTPLDMSFGLQRSGNAAVRDYYITGIDAYRLIVNDDIGAPFVPKKQFMRSEPIDFQRGEVEWRGGNLYFDKWNYHIEVESAPAEE